MMNLLSSLYNLFFCASNNIAIHSRVNRIATVDGSEKIDGLVMKIEGNSARVCWSKGEKTQENIGNLVAIVD
ncbi:hypothetical protein [Iodobacter fluviatilis]|jgi:hypothetical protein|uniref:Uncharacterized protein n=1 Tax=Iodobacter fluviatilis TaxID=537 RepID=A0A7G3G8H9_9NEIS|nr:hypothetical protein [Iodobacter fluviatilis]QBC43464.1 hypothetical protein C1H71_07865 [Iodobacter fluviatilis]